MDVYVVLIFPSVYFLLFHFTGLERTNDPFKAEDRSWFWPSKLQRLNPSSHRRVLTVAWMHLHQRLPIKGEAAPSLVSDAKCPTWSGPACSLQANSGPGLAARALACTNRRNSRARLNRAGWSAAGLFTDGIRCSCGICHEQLCVFRPLEGCRGVISKPNLKPNSDID